MEPLSGGKQRRKPSGTNGTAELAHHVDKCGVLAALQPLATPDVVIAENGTMTAGPVRGSQAVYKNAAISVSLKLELFDTLNEHRGCTRLPHLGIEHCVV